MYVVEGGVFSDTTFTTIEDGTREFYGPFDTYEEAKAVWFAKTMRRVDTCEHRLFIRPRFLGLRLDD